MDRKAARELARELVLKMTIEERASQLRYDALISPPITGGTRPFTEWPGLG